ncbi:hypothetical protein B0H13DRAFT_2096645 [Mycena leptocephala]|nr:hypothetical protein B0H13DRAFT_2096645 [Mycena leptocephala]
MIKLLYTFPQSVGIADGRPSSSYYFVAVFTIQLRGSASRCAARLFAFCSGFLLGLRVILLPLSSFLVRMSRQYLINVCLFI